MLMISAASWRSSSITGMCQATAGTSRPEADSIRSQSTRDDVVATRWRRWLTASGLRWCARLTTSPSWPMRYCFQWWAARCRHAGDMRRLVRRQMSAKDRATG